MFCIKFILETNENKALYTTAVRPTLRLMDVKYGHSNWIENRIKINKVREHDVKEDNIFDTAREYTIKDNNKELRKEIGVSRITVFT